MLYTFAGGDSGPWRIDSISPVEGDPLPEVGRLNVTSGPTDGCLWQLHGVTSNERYVTRSEKQQLLTKQQLIGRPEATCAALIPIRKNEAWWALTQDERREILEDGSHHIRIGLEYLPAIARRLHHCRDLSHEEPFDFLTWFDFAPGDAAGFEELLARLRATEEWAYVDREVDIRATFDG